MTLPPSPDPVPPLRRATVRSVDSVRADVRRLWLVPDAPLDYRAGQYIDIAFGGLSARPYSIACAPGGDALEIHIKKGMGPASRYVMDTLQPGEAVLFTGPHGQAVYDDTVRGPVLALAGGLGIAPIRAIAQQAARRTTGDAAPFTLVWSAVRPADRYMDDAFAALAGNRPGWTYVPVTGPPDEMLRSLPLPDPAAWHVYLSGPPAMIGVLLPILLERGVERGKIRYDRHPEAAGGAA